MNNITNFNKIYFQIINEAKMNEIPPILYHATFKRFIPNIKKTGLGNTKRKLWENSEPHTVYLATDEDQAASYMEAVIDEYDLEQYADEPIVIIKIDTSKLNHNLFELDKNNESNFDYVNDSNFDLDQDLDYTLEYHGIIPASSFIDIYEYQ